MVYDGTQQPQQPDEDEFNDNDWEELAREAPQAFLDTDAMDVVADSPDRPSRFQRLL